MNTFIQKYEPHIKGVLSGFDRIVFRGTLRALAVIQGMKNFLWHRRVLLKDFGAFAEETTQMLKEASLQAASDQSRPVVYLASSSTSKEKTARQIAERDGITEGLICVLKTVEPCMSYGINRNREKKKLELYPQWRKGLALYHYWLDDNFGLMYGRIQTWLPCSIQIGMNGREWLAKQMDRAGIAYRKVDNAFPWIEDVPRAQALMDQMRRLHWSSVLGNVAQQLNPVQEQILHGYRCSYYWTLYQSEWATDVMFDSRETVEALYPLLTRGAMEAFSCQQVMRFFGKRSHFEGEVVSDCRTREEGVRIKHFLNDNSIKAYDKGSILRAETTINSTRDFRTYRASERDPKGNKKWLPMSKGIADLNRRADVCQAANDRYLNALATLDTDTPVRDLVEPVCRAKTVDGRRVRALRPWSEPDRSLLEAVNDGDFCINGFRNRDVFERLYPNGIPHALQRRRARARISRMFRLLRDHGLIAKVPKTYRYNVTEKGRCIITAVLRYQAVTLKKLAEKAA